MSIIITYPSALEFWKSYSGPVSLTTYERDSLELPTDPHERNIMIKSAKELGFTLPLHIMVSHRAKRSHGASFICHVLPQKLPANSYVQVSPDIYVISPECCYLLAAVGASVPDLALMATDLCSIYSLNSDRRYGQNSRDQITSVCGIETYLNHAPNMRGIQKARAAIKYAFDRSNSPIESKLAVIASLPCMYGGFALPRPQLNEMINLSKEGAALLNRDTCCCDMVWLAQKVVLEYDSDLTHSSVKQMHYDKKRSTAITASGFKVIQVTRDDFRNQNTIDNLFALIRNTLGMKGNHAKLVKFKNVHFELVKKLFLMAKWF